MPDGNRFRAITVAGDERTAAASLGEDVFSTPVQVSGDGTHYVAVVL